MDMSDNESHVIQLKSCPRCFTPIRTSLRYGNVIKQRLQDIEKVKVRAHGHPSEMDETKRRLQTRLADLERIFDGENEMREWRRLERSVQRITKGTVAAVTENQVTLMERFCVMNQKLNQQLLEPRGKSSADIGSESLSVQRELEHLRKRVMSQGVTEREIRDLNVEFSRQNLKLELYLLHHDVKNVGLNLKRNYLDIMSAVQNKLSSGRLVEEERLDEMLRELDGIRQAYRFLSPITPEEKKEIVSAMSLSQGRWYKCPQGHVYTIGGCGQAMQRSTCPDCRVVIGGTGHRLIEGNIPAFEMNSARTRYGRRQQNYR